MIATQSPTLFQLLHLLGDIDPDRVLMTPPPGTATEADLLACGRKLVELVDGVLVEKAMGSPESFLAGLIYFRLMMYRSTNDIGVFGLPDTLHRLTPEIVRQPDVSFTSWLSMPDTQAHRNQVSDYPPDLAVEVISPSERRGEIRRKIADYFAAGTKLVWVVDPRAETVTVYTDVLNSTTLTKTETLTGGSVLPGFSLVLSDLFDDPQLKPRPTTGA